MGSVIVKMPLSASCHENAALRGNAAAKLLNTAHKLVNLAGKVKKPAAKILNAADKILNAAAKVKNTAAKINNAAAGSSCTSNFKRGQEFLDKEYMETGHACSKSLCQSFYR